MRSSILMITVAFMLLITACATAPSKPVEFATEPQTPDEQAVAQMLESWMAALNEPNLDRYLSYYAPEATIEADVTKGITSKDVYAAAMRSVKIDTRIVLKHTKIEMIPPDRSHVEADQYNFLRSGTQIKRHSFDLVRRDGQWLIVEERHL